MDEMAAFLRAAVAACLKGVSAETVVAMVNISRCRVLKPTGKVWDQLCSEDQVWLLTAREWKEYSDNVLVLEFKTRHGKKLVIRNPAAMSPKQLFDMVDVYFPDVPKVAPAPPSPAAKVAEAPSKGKGKGARAAPNSKSPLRTPVSVLQRQEKAHRCRPLE